MPRAIWPSAAASKSPWARATPSFPKLFAVLEEQQYRGYITVARHDTSDPLADVRQAIEFLRNL